MEFLPGLWNRITPWPLLIIHVFGWWEQFPIHDVNRNGGWYQFGFLIWAGSPLLGLIGRVVARGDRVFVGQRSTSPDGFPADKDIVHWQPRSLHPYLLCVHGIDLSFPGTPRSPGVTLPAQALEGQLPIATDGSASDRH
jgi:hypothetical protein